MAGNPVKVAVRGLHQSPRIVAVRAVALGAKGVQRSQDPAGSDSKHCPAAVGTVRDPAPGSGPVKVAVCSQDQGAGIPAISAIDSRAKAVEGGQCATGGDLEDGSGIIGSPSTRVGDPVEVAVRRLHQGTVRIGAVNAVDSRAKAIDRGQRAAGGDFENRPAAGRRAIVSTAAGGSVEVAIRAAR